MRDGAGVVGRIFANTTRLLGGKAGAGLISLAYLAMATRALGAGDYGVLVLVHGFVMLLGGVIEFPGWHAVVRYGAQALAAGDEARLARLIKFAAVLELGCGLLAAVAIAIAAPIVGQHLGWTPAAIALSLPYSAAVLATVRATPAGYLQLVGRYDLLGLHTLLAPAVRLAGATIALVAGWGLAGWLWIWLAAALVEFAAMWIFAFAVAPHAVRRGVLTASLSGVRGENPGLWRFMWGANADVTLSELGGRLMPIAVGWTLGPGAAGLFAVAQRATVVVSQPAQTLGQAAYAELARLAAGARDAAVLPAVLRTIGWALLSAAPFCVVAVFFGREIVTLLGGAGFAAAGGLMAWLGVARTIQVGGPPLSAALTALGRPGSSAVLNGVSTLIPILVLLAVVPTFGFAALGPVCLFQAGLGFVLLSGAILLRTQPPRAIASLA